MNTNPALDDAGEEDEAGKGKKKKEKPPKEKKAKKEKPPKEKKEKPPKEKKEKEPKEKKEKPPKEKKEKAPKAPKPPKPPKAAKVKKEKPPKEKKEKKPKSGGSPLMMFLGIFLFFLVLVAGGVVLVYFDIGGSKEIVNQFLNYSDFAQEAKLSIVQEAQKKVDSDKAEIEKKQTYFDVQNKDLDAKVKEIDEREAAVIKREQALESPSPSPGASGQADSGGTAVSSDLKVAVKTLVAMDPADAAKILEGLTDEAYLMRIIRSMNGDARAAILTEMNTAKATSIIASLDT